MHLGSCFSEHIGKKFMAAGFQCAINPMGQQYNLFSIASAIRRMILCQTYEESDLGKQGDLYYSFDHHSDFSGTDAAAMLCEMNLKLTQSHQLLQKAQYIFITPGTSHYYIHQDSGKIVSNCHKIPAHQFDMRMADPHENEGILRQLISEISAFNPGAKIILTLSPVRYAALGFPMNTYSKSSLIIAIHQVVKAFEHIYYFPSYEMILDDLRDYRFYESDFIHPGSSAINYIWEKILSTFCDDACKKAVDEIEAVYKASWHRPRQLHSEAHQSFIQHEIRKIEALQKRYFYTDFSEMLHRFELQLKPTI